MQVTHAKVSGIPNPVDETIVGGDDWNDPHTITGWVFLGAITVQKTVGNPATVVSYTGIVAPTVYDYDNNNVYMSLAELNTSIANWHVYVDPVTYNSGFGGFMRHRVTNRGDGSNEFNFNIETVAINPNGTENYGPDCFYINALLYKKL